MIETSDDIAKLATALHVAQGKMTGVKRDATNPAFKRRYATLENVIDVARPALQDAGIAWVQAPGKVVDGNISVTTMLVHVESGQWLRSTVDAPLSKRDAQGVGSCITYLCRYSLMAMLGLPPTDDDAAGAVDWVGEARELTNMVRRAQALEELTALWGTERVKSFRSGAPGGIVEEVHRAFKDRKAALAPVATMPVEEAA